MIVYKKNLIMSNFLHLFKLLSSNLTMSTYASYLIIVEKTDIFNLKTNLIITTTYLMYIVCVLYINHINWTTYCMEYIKSIKSYRQSSLNYLNYFKQFFRRINFLK